MVGGSTMSRVTRAEWYRRVNEAWPAPVPALTAEEAVRAFRRLYRFGRGRTLRAAVGVTSGRRYTGRSGGQYWVNPARGWHHLVHVLSHLCEPSGHNAAHARMELRMIKEVVRRGWLEGRLRSPAKAEPSAPVDVRAVRYRRLLKREKAWTSRAKRAATALRKIRLARGRYERLGVAA